MIHRLITVGAALGMTLVLAVSSAWGASSPSRDAGDASGARLELAKSAQVVRDAGDATSAKLAFSTRHGSPVMVVRDAGDATAATSGRSHGGVHKLSNAQFVRDSGDATQAKLNSGSRSR